MSLCYLMQNSYWQRYCHRWQNWFTGSNQQLVLAVSSGAAGSFCTYLAACIWADAENPWMATGAILQGSASLITLGILLWSLWHKNDSTVEKKVDSLLSDLSHHEPLKRLIAIRQLTRLLITQSLAADHYSQSIEYFHLMLSEPQTSIVKNALLESLELLDTKQIARLKSQKELKLPLNLKYSHQSIEALRD